MHEQRRLLTAEEAAKILSIGRTRVFELMAAGNIVSVRIGRSRRIPADAIDDYISKLTAEHDAA